MESHLNKSILVGHTSKETAYKVDDYPWGFRLRTSIHYWIETKEGFGDRFCSYTINPKTGRACAPKCGTYSTFLYMYIDEETGHVKHGGIDSYHKDVFQARFYFILNQIGEQYLSEEQKDNIRRNHYQHVRLSYPYDKVKYKPESQPAYTAWMNATLKHIKECEFKDLVDYPDEPAQDNPDGEIKMTTTTYTSNG